MQVPSVLLLFFLDAFWLFFDIPFAVFVFSHGILATLIFHPHNESKPLFHCAQAMAELIMHPVCPLARDVPRGLYPAGFIDHPGHTFPVPVPPG